MRLTTLQTIESVPSCFKIYNNNSTWSRFIWFWVFFFNDFISEVSKRFCQFKLVFLQHYYEFRNKSIKLICTDKRIIFQMGLKEIVTTKSKIAQLVNYCTKSNGAQLYIREYCSSSLMLIYARRYPCVYPAYRQGYLLA